MSRSLISISLVAFVLSCARSPEANFPPALSAPSAGPSPDLYSVTWLDHEFPAEVKHGTQVLAAVTFKNSSPRVWNHFVRFNYTWRLDGAAPGPYEPNRTFFGRPVAPGEAVSLDHVLVDVPAKAGLYTLVFVLVNESVAWFPDRGAKALSIPVRVS